MAISLLFSTHIAGASFDTSGTVVDTVLDIGTGSNLFAICPVSWGQNNSHTMENAPSWNSIAMSAFGAQVTGTNNRKHNYYLANPATGSNTLRVDPSTGGGTTDQVVIPFFVFADVDVSGTPYDGYTTNTGTDGSAPFDSTVTVTSATGDHVFVSHAGSLSGGNPSAIAPTNYTERHETLDAAFGVSSGDAAGAASVATTATFSSAGFSLAFNAMGVNLNAAAGGAFTPRLTLLGVG